MTICICYFQMTNKRGKIQIIPLRPAWELQILFIELNESNMTLSIMFVSCAIPCLFLMTQTIFFLILSWELTISKGHYCLHRKHPNATKSLKSKTFVVPFRFFVFAVWQYLNSFANLEVVGCIMYFKPELLLISVLMLKFSKSSVKIFPY